MARAAKRLPSIVVPSIMSPPTLEAEEVSIMLVGSFNPGIFHPEWFRRQEILLPGEVEEAKTGMVSSEVTQVEFLDMRLQVFPDHFLLATADVSRAEKLQDIVINVLNRLPHTPITACGLNNSVEFALKDEAYWHRIGHTLAPKARVWEGVLEKPGMLSLVIKGMRGGEFPGEVNVTVAPARPRSTLTLHGLFIGSNFHFAIPRDETGTFRSELAGSFVQKEWKRALEQARLVAYRIFSEIK